MNLNSWEKGEKLIKKIDKLFKKARQGKIMLRKARRVYSVTIETDGQSIHLEESYGREVLINYIDYAQKELSRLKKQFEEL